jgi:spore coat polysaccharide biosynthesis protein SpsF
MKKAGIISQVRMASTRLPGKVMLSIGEKPLLWYFNERLQKSGVPLYLATSTNPNNDIIEAFGKENGVIVFRGDEDNVLKRYYDCAKEHGLDVIVRITSDCPLSDGAMIKEALSVYLAFNDDHVHFSNCVELSYPHGLNFEIFSFKLLEDAYLHATDPFHLEHVTPYIIQNKPGNVVLKHFTRKEDASMYRVTVDTYDDFLLIQKLIEEHSADKKSTEEIIGIFKKHPELVEINRLKGSHVWGNGKVK